MKPDSSSFSLWRLPVLAATALLGIAGIARAATPTLTSVSILNGNNEDSSYTISYAILAAAANEHDDDAGDDISFRVESVTNGTLRKNGVAVEPGVTLLSSTGASWSWTPPANDNGVIDAFTIKVTDGTNVSTTTPVQVRIQVDPVSDPVQVSGSVLSSIDDNSSATALFPAVTITDADFNKPAATTVAMVVRIPKTAGEKGTFNFGSAVRTEVGSDYVYTYPALSPGNATTQIRAATFDPTPNLTAGGTSSAFSIRLTVSDDSSADEVNGNLTVNSINDPAVLTLSFNPSTIPDTGESKPFRISIVDPDIGDESKVLTLNLTETGTAKGTLIIGTPLTGTAAQLQTAMQNVRYQPFPVEGSATAQFSCSASGSLTATGSLTIGNTNDPPDIAGITTQLQFTTDDPGAPDVFPFKSVTITDPDFIAPGVPQPLTATITLDDPARGDAVPATLTGTAQQLTQQLRLVKFVPKPNRVAVGDSETTILTLSVTDGTASKSNGQTKVATLSVNGAPAIVGIPSGIQSVSQTPPILPFAGLSVEDDDAVAQVTITVSLDDPAKGSFVNPVGFTETSTGSHIYTFSGLADAHGETVSPVTVALRALNFAPNANYSFPPNLPGYTTFTIDVSDSLQNHTIRSFSIVLANASRNFLVTSKSDLADPPAAGTLRYALAKAKDNDVITFAFNTYPVVIRINPALPALVLKKHLRFKGPGADLLTISGDYDGNSQPDSRLFQVQATVSMEGLTLTQGIAQAGGGGAFQVGRNPSQPSSAPGNLTLSYCAITNCRAAQWGGAIDVEEGSLSMDHCLLKGNSTDPALGLGGGAVSLYTTAPCSFTATTFSGNLQRSTTGFGGGALYAENFNPQVIFPVTVTQCTFAENQDAAGNGSSIHSNVFNCRVTTRGSIFADGSERNLHVAGSGQILSQGRNLSDDAARTILIQSGQPQLISLLNQISDQPSTQPLLLPLLKGIGPTETYGLSPVSPAIGTVAAVEGTDQRGVVRDGTPDSGAVEYDHRERVVINEVQMDSTAPTPFIEFYIPRDSAPVDFNGMSVYIDNRLIPCHTFNASLAVQPGQGLILAQSAAGITLPALSTTGVIQSANPFWPSADHLRTTIELRVGTVVVASASLVNVFANPNNPDLNIMTLAGNSLSLAPQFVGQAYVPNSYGQSPPLGPDPAHGGQLSSPGADTGNTPFGLPNAFPFAAADSFNVSEDDLITLPVLANDSDADGLDKLVLVDVSTARSAPVNSPPVGSDATSVSSLGSGVSIAPSAAPLRGTTLWYDPRVALNHLPVGVSAQDTFYYTIVDLGAGPVTTYEAGGGSATKVTSAGHRLTTGEQITITGTTGGAYDGTFPITFVDANTFTIPRTFTTNPAAKGSWVTVGTRLTTSKSENAAVVTVMGRNDAPTPSADTVATTEEQILRIMGDPDLIATAPVFDTDPAYPLPRTYSNVSLLSNDHDPDDDDNTFKKLRIIGVTQAQPVLQYLGNPGVSPVTVKAPAHGFTTGATVLISGYGGHASYNDYHVVTVVDADTFTIPINFVEDNAQRGLCGILTSDGRLHTTSAMGAGVNLEIRSSRLETNIVYVPRGAPLLNRLSKNELAADSFYYVAEDSHGAAAFAKVTVNVTGVNDAPVPQNDPPSLNGLSPLILGGSTLPDILAGAKVQYTVPSTPDKSSVTLTAGPSGDLFVLSDVPRTDEDTALTLTTSSLLSNDTDVDHLDVLSVSLGAGQNVSREGASITLGAGGSTILYNPAVSARLNALAREESIVDTFSITVNDGTTGVTALVAVVVTGKNDRPVALADSVTIPEDQLLTLGPPGVLLNDHDADQDTHIPDNRKVLLSVADAGTTVYGTHISTAVAPAEGAITGFQAVSGSPALTKLISPGHGLQSGEEVAITGTAVDAFNGQWPITRIDADSFSIPVPAASGAASAGTGTWRSLRSTLTYDPRGSVFNGAPANTVFTLDGLAQGESYLDTWTYTMLDGSFIFANDDAFRVAADSTGVILPVSTNDVNLTGLTGPLTIISVGTPSQRGTAAIGENNTITYTPEISFVGDEYFTYTVQDSYGSTDTALVTVHVTIEQLNGNLQANADAFTVAKGQSPLLAILANDDVVPATGAALTITKISTPPNAGGTVVIEGTAVRYTPVALAPAYPYNESFSYEISAGGTARAIATVALQVVNREDTLPLRTDAVSVTADSAGNLLDVLANDNILPGSGLALTIQAAGTPVPPTTAHGTVQISSDAKRLVYTPNAGFVGTDKFQYTVSDGFGGTGSSSVSVVVGGLTTNNDFFTVSSAAVVPNTLDVLANDRVLGNSGGVSIKSVTPSSDALGSMAVSVDHQKLVFTPNLNVFGEKVFTYRIEDGTGREADGSVTVFLSAPGLRANSDFFTVQTNSSSNELHILLNDAVIPDLGQHKSIVSVGTGPNAPDHGGTVLINATNDRLLYTPFAGFIGEEKFTCTVSDGENTASAQVVVRVSDGALFAGDDWFSVYKGSSQMRLEVLANDRLLPPGGQLLTITGVGIIQNAPGQQGTVTITEDGGGLLYTPNPANTVYPYTESFTYEVSDGTARRAAGTVRIEILDRAGAREMETNDDAFTVLAGSQNTLLAVLANDDIRPSFAAGWEITATGAPNQGGVAVVSGPGILYTPRAGFVGTETFTYDTSDGLGGTGKATVTVKVGDVLVSDDVFTVLSGTTSNSLDVLSNDGLFPDGFPDPANRPGLTGFTLSTAPMTPNHGGTATVSGDHIVYRPAANFTGAETFTYWVQDDSGVKFPGKVVVNVEAAGSDRQSALLSILVTGVNDAPFFTNPHPTTTTDRTGIYPFANTSITDVDSQNRQRVTVRVTWPAERGTLTGGFTLVSPGVVEFTGSPAEATAALRGLLFTPVENRIPVGQTEETVFNVTLDDHFVSSPVVVTGNGTTVTPVNDPPVLTGAVANQFLYQRSTLRPFAGVNITDADNLGLQPQTVSVKIDNPIKGILTNTGGFAQQPPNSGIYTMTGTPAAVAAALRGMVFEPTPENRITPALPETSTFTITVNDGFAAPLVDAITTVVVLHAEVDRLLPLNNTTGVDASQASADFGGSTAISGDTLVIGSPRRDTPADAGAAYVYERNAGFGAPWGQVAILAPADLKAGDRFGESVTISGDVIAVGAPQSEQAGGPNNAGAVYVFRRNPANRNEWLQAAKLLPPLANGSGGDNFGSSVAVSGTTLFVGAPHSNLPGESNAGRVHVFERDQGGAGTWGVAQSLSGSDERTDDNFGNAVAVNGNTAVIGAADTSRTRNDSGWELGAVFVFDRPSAGGTWTESRKIQNFADSEARPYDHFGYSVDVDKDTIIVGSPHFDSVVGGVRHPDSGAAFVYDRNTGGAGQWGLVTKLASPTALDAELYGHAVAVSGDLFLVGAPKEPSGGIARGFVEVRRRNQNGANAWGLIDRLNAGPASTTDRIGCSVTLDGFTGAAGAIDDNGVTGTARVYQFQYDLGPRQAIVIPNQTIAENQPFLFTVPAGAFGDPVYGAQLTYSAVLPNGNPLPAGWLSFNPATATFSGTPVPASNADYTLVVRATNPLGTTVQSNVFTVKVLLDPARALQRLYAVWAAAHFPAATIANTGLEATVWGPLANPDGDPSANLLEMLYGTDPLVYGLPPVTVGKLAGPQVTATFPWAQGLPLDFIHVEWSTTLQSWSRANVGYVSFTDNNGQRWITATVYPESAEQKVLLRIAVGL